MFPKWTMVAIGIVAAAALLQHLDLSAKGEALDRLAGPFSDSHLSVAGAFPNNIK